MYQWNGKPRRNGYILRKVQPSRTKKKQKRWTDQSQILKLKLWLKNSQQAKVQDQVASQMNSFNIYRISLVQTLSCVQVFATPCRRPCPSPTLRACSNSCPSCWWCHPACSSSVIPLSSCLQSFPASGSFQISQLFASGVPKYWSFSFRISPSNEYAGLMSITIDWFDLLAVQGTLKSLLQHHSSKAILQHSAFFIVQLCIHTWLLEKT